MIDELVFRFLDDHHRVALGAALLVEIRGRPRLVRLLARRRLVVGVVLRLARHANQ